MVVAGELARRDGHLLLVLAGSSSTAEPATRLARPYGEPVSREPVRPCPHGSVGIPYTSRHGNGVSARAMRPSV